MAGAEDIRLMIRRPQERAGVFRPPEDVTVETGELLCLHVAVSTERYWAEATRTFHAGPGNFECVQSDALRERFRGLVARIRPGTSVRDLVHAARAGMSHAEWLALETCGVGHGIGVTPEETPVLSESCDETFAAGMCLVVRAAFLHEGRIVLHGDTVVL
jgi:Xaa-Pro aminopeptidase